MLLLRLYAIGFHAQWQEIGLWRMCLRNIIYFGFRWQPTWFYTGHPYVAWGCVVPCVVSRANQSCFMHALG